MYYSTIGLLAALILCIVNWDILRNAELYGKPAWNVYKRFLFSILAYDVIDTLWGFLEYRKLSTALFVDTTVYFIAMAVVISFWTDFIVAYLHEKSAFGRFLIYAGRVIAGLIAGVTVLNLFTPVLFTLDSSCVYHALPVRYAVLICQILFFLVISLYVMTYMIRNGSTAEQSSRYRILAFFGGIMALCMFVQLWFPYLPLYSIAYMLGTCVLHSFVIHDEREESRQRLEETRKLAELKERFHSLLDHMPGMTFTKDAETGIYLACNQALADYAHKEKPEDVIGLKDADLFDAQTTAKFLEADRIALSLSKPYIYYEDVTDAEGNPRQLQTTKLRYKDTQGRSCVLGMCQDITDLVRIRHEQAKTSEAYESAVKTGLMYTHMAQTLARDYMELFCVNTDTEEFTEYRRGETDSTLSEIRHGWHFFSDCKAELCESVYPDDKDTFMTAMNRKKLMNALSRKDTFVATYRRLVQDKPVYVSMKISRMENDEQFIIIGFMDVDAEMREAMAKNAALSDALSSAETANHTRTTFLAGMSHEIRTPLNAIIGLDTLALKNQDLDDKTRGYFEKIGDSAQHLHSLINEILEMSRFESGRETLHNTAFSLGDLLHQVKAQVMSRCSEKGLQYECNVLQPEEDHYIGDGQKLRKALLYILRNVIRLTKENGNITMTVEKMPVHRELASLRFGIRTTGSAETYEAFSGNDDLSMGIAKRIIEMMNGSIHTEPVKDGGTEVTVTISLRNGDSTETQQTGEMDPQALFVLVVDDNPIEAEHARMVLEEVGIHADSCTNGQDALRKMEIQYTRRHPYNLVLMDWNMPGMNGKETSAEILRLYENESIVVAMTAYSWDDIREEAHDVGVDDYLEKPLTIATVVENLGRIAQRNSMAVFKEKKKARLEGRRILVAEDVEINAEILMDMLEMENIKADHAENGKIAVELFENSTAGIYSAILMDVRMPQMDGLEAARTIRAMDREDAKRIPIIALTANSFDEDVQLSIQAGMNAHLNKPVEADHLIQILGELVYKAEESLTVK